MGRSSGDRNVGELGHVQVIDTQIEGVDVVLGCGVCPHQRAVSPFAAATLDEAADQSWPESEISEYSLRFSRSIRIGRNFIGSTRSKMVATSSSLKEA